MCLSINIQALESSVDVEMPSTPVGQVMGEGFLPDEMMTAPATPVKQLSQTPEGSYGRHLPLILTTPLKQIGSGQYSDSESLHTARSQFSNGIATFEPFPSSSTSVNVNPFTDKRTINEAIIDDIPLNIQQPRLVREFTTSKGCQVWESLGATWVSLFSKVDGMPYTIKVSKKTFSSTTDAQHLSVQYPGCARYHNSWEENGFVFVQLQQLLPCKPSLVACYGAVSQLHSSGFCHGSRYNVVFTAEDGGHVISDLTHIEAISPTLELAELSSLF
eukprot:TRINITY_DN2337_c0_g2_i1.p1 TRINITY_DN2337_c0_g2~~TRINITY_DN2337_c0_g2_i1.p1  ORF type:complete len:293 (+),score=56.09 TRINITY_DN2337_c0_g2_i1:60-881(+)